MFEASHPFAFFDYYRVPYELSMAEDSNEPGHARATVGRITVTGSGEDRSLYWLRPDAIGNAQGKGCRLGRYKLANFTLVGSVVLDAAVPEMLREFGTGWRPAADAIITADSRPVAAVWRDANGNVFLPFDPGEVMHYFWSEKYRGVDRSALSAVAKAAVLRAYYLARPALPRPVQLRLRQKFTRVQGRSSFPGWPIEDNLQNFYSWMFAHLAAFAGRPVPFIDVWPDGRSWALVLTHDVETAAGCQDIHLLRSIERDRGYKSSWNFVPLRYQVGDEVLDALRDEGCEIGVHGLRHDGRDLESERMVEKRLPAMRSYADRWNAIGFRSPATQRGWELMPLLGFDYDSSYSDSDPYEPQPGGCCTYLPYFNEKMVELPITMAQDHTLFAILQQPDAGTWLRKARHIREKGGMVLVLTHPDYAHDSRVADGYRQVLDEFHGDDTVWHALPKDVAAWWRDRADSSICKEDGGWQIAGPAGTRGRVRVATPQSA